MLPIINTVMLINELILFENELNLQQKVETLRNTLRDRYPLKSLYLFLNLKDGLQDLRLDSIIVEREYLGTGVGTNVLSDIIRFADKHNLRVTLTPGLKDKLHGTTSRSRLINFYKRFGFKQNAGKAKDYRISDTMIRYPRTG